MAGSDELDGDDACCGEETDPEADVDSVEATGWGFEIDPLQPRSHAIIKTEEKIIFKSGFIDTTLTDAL
jgi:hypothetical protein